MFESCSSLEDGRLLWMLVYLLGVYAPLPCFVFYIHVVYNVHVHTCMCYEGTQNDDFWVPRF